MRGQLRTLFSQQAIAARVAELGEQLTSKYQGQELIVIGVLKGAVVFLADLIRQLELPIHLDFMAVSSYGMASQSSGAVRILKDLDTGVEGKNLLLVEDIVDTGITLNYLLNNLRTRGPASLQVCAFLDKPERRQVPIELDYVGFRIPDVFVVGYGLDYAQQYRNLPYLAEIELDTEISDSPAEGAKV